MGIASFLSRLWIMENSRRESIRGFKCELVLDLGVDSFGQLS